MMPRLEKRRAYIPFGRKLLVSYLVLVLTPVILIGCYAYFLSVHSLTSQTLTSIHGNLQQVVENIRLKVGEIKRVSDQLYFDTTLQRTISSDYNGQYEIYDAVENRIKPSINAALRTSSTNLVVDLYMDNKQLPEINSQMTEISQGYLLGSRYSLVRMTPSGWYNRGLVSNYETIWRQIEDDRKYGNISLLRKMNNIEQGMDPIGYLRIVVKDKELFKAADNSKLGEETILYFVDGYNQVLFRSPQDTRDSLKMSDQLNDSHYLKVSEEINELGLTLVALIPASEMQRDALRVRNLTILLCFVSFILLFGIGLLTSRYFARRVAKINLSLNAFRQGEFHKRIRFSGNDEFSEIAASYNNMAEHIEELINEVYVSTLKKKESELEALQAQINPHFLYNTLSSISRLAKLGKIDHMHDMILGLARFYRLTLNEGRRMISIQNEIEQAQAYLSIQSMKYGDKLHLLYDIDPAVYPFQTLKIILQPFLENVLKHAWYRGQMTIRIVVYSENSNIIFKIIDTGIGMSQETLKQLFIEGEAKRGYGIRNVDQRIKLQFGDKYGIRIASRRGMGTGVQITIPQIMDEKRFDSSRTQDQE